MLQLSANGQSLMSHIDDDGIMTMMWAKMSAVISSDSMKATNYVAALPLHCRRKDSVKFVWIFCTLTTGGNYSDTNLF